MDDRVTTKRPPMPTFGNMLNTLEFQRGFRAAAKSIDSAKKAFAAGLKVEIDESREVRDKPKAKTNKTAAIAQGPRLPKELDKRHRILAAKVKSADCKSAMHLALKVA